MMRKIALVLSAAVLGGLLSTVQAGDYGRDRGKDHGKDRGRVTDARKSFCEGISVELIDTTIIGGDAVQINSVPATVANALEDCLLQCNESDGSESYDGTPEFACVREISTTLLPGNDNIFSFGGQPEPDIIKVTGRCLRERKCPERDIVEVVPPNLGPDCSAVTCPRLECAAGELLVTSSNECCPRCVSERGSISSDSNPID